MRISDKQQELLAFIEKFVEEKGYPPTLEEIRTGLVLSSKSLVNYHLEVLENEGYITRSPNTSRGIRLTTERETIRVPFVTDHHFTPNTDLEVLDPEEAIELTGDIVPNRRDLYALRVNCDSMVDAFVNKGDIVIMQRQKRAKNGEMVAVHLMDRNATVLKRFYRENGHVRLQAANPHIEALIVSPETVRVQGKVVAVIRQLN